MNAFEEYVYEVSRRLPRSTRKELTRELSADLNEELEILRLSNAGVSAELLMKRILNLRDSPALVVESLNPQGKALIGPNLYPAYRYSLSISLVVGALISVSFFGVLGLKSISGVMAIAVNAALSTCVVAILVTIIFVVIDRFGTHSIQDLHGARALAEEFFPRRVGVVSGPLAAISIAALIHLLPKWIGIYWLSTSPVPQLVIIPILSDHFLASGVIWVYLWAGFALCMWGAGRLPALHNTGVHAVALMAFRVFEVAAGLRLAFVPVFAFPPPLRCCNMASTPRLKQRGAVCFPGLSTS